MSEGNLWQFIGLLSHYSDKSPGWLTAMAFVSAGLSYATKVVEWKRGLAK